MSKLTPGDAAAVLHAYKAPTSKHAATNTLVSRFQSLIEATATQISPSWRTDLIQEGNIALINAADKFPADQAPTKFLGYAYTAIKRGMLYFMRSLVLKQDTFAHSVDTTSNVSALLRNSTDSVDYCETTTLAIDFKYTLNATSMRQHHFSQREITIFDLHFRQGFNVTEVSNSINLSIAQTSKLVSKTKEKIQHYLSFCTKANLK